MAKILKNTTASPITIYDTGVIIPSSTNYTIDPQNFPLWSASVDVDTHINSGTLIVNDGYDDLKIDLGKKHIHSESVPRESAFVSTATVQATAASTLTLTAISRLLYIFTGTTAGQIVKLPSATTLNIGYRYEVWNTSNQSVEIKNDGSTSLFTLAASQKTWITLQNNSTANGTWLFEANFLGGTGGGNGTCVFGFDGTASTGRWLETSTNIASSLTGYTMAGTKAIRSLSITGATGANYTATATIYQNGSVLDTITLTSARKNSKLNLNYLLSDKDEITAQVTSGSVARPVVVLWL